MFQRLLAYKCTIYTIYWTINSITQLQHGLQYPLHTKACKKRRYLTRTQKVAKRDFTFCQNWGKPYKYYYIYRRKRTYVCQNWGGLSELCHLYPNIIVSIRLTLNRAVSSGAPHSITRLN